MFKETEENYYNKRKKRFYCQEYVKFKREEDAIE